MRYGRCHGLMVREKFEDLGGLGSSEYESAGWRCINCGAIVDPVITAHRSLRSASSDSSGIDNSVNPIRPRKQNRMTRMNEWGCRH